MRKSKSNEPLRKVKRKVEPQAQLRVDEKANGVEAKAESESRPFPEISTQCDELEQWTNLGRHNEHAKRQRTNSGSASSASQSKSCRRDADSENEIERSEKPKNIRGAAARNNRNKEGLDRGSQREKERAEAPGGRKGRAERRRGDGKVP